MKRSLLVATGVLALAAVSQPLFAAETETPAPIERAAPAAERAPAPAAERAPAQERRARPAQQRQAVRNTGQQPSQSQTSSYTGVQAGGFGGGNAGGGGFADPSFCGDRTFNPTCGTTTQNIGKNTGALGGLEIGQMIPMGGYWAWGWAVDAQASTLRSEGNQQTTKLTGGLTITEGMSTSQTQPFMTTARLAAW